jgi:Ulp1 family protease
MRNISNEGMKLIKEGILLNDNIINFNLNFFYKHFKNMNNSKILFLIPSLNNRGNGKITLFFKIYLFK